MKHFDKKTQLYYVLGAFIVIGIVSVYLKPLQKFVAAPIPTTEASK